MNKQQLTSWTNEDVRKGNDRQWKKTHEEQAKQIKPMGNVVVQTDACVPPFQNPKDKVQWRYGLWLLGPTSIVVAVYCTNLFCTMAKRHFDLNKKQLRIRMKALGLPSRNRTVKSMWKALLSHSTHQGHVVPGRRLSDFFSGIGGAFLGFHRQWMRMVRIVCVRL